MEYAHLESEIMQGKVAFINDLGKPKNKVAFLFLLQFDIYLISLKQIIHT